MAKIHWILQSNLIRENIFNEIKAALLESEISFEEVKIIPFSDELPTIQKHEEINIFYGSTTLVLNAYKQLGKTTGIFYDELNFNMKKYLEKWGSKMLNSDSKILTFKEIIQSNLYKNNEWFIRPIEDDKSFSGRVMTFNEMIDFEKELESSNNPYLTTETLIGISTPKSIEKEWRLFIVDKKVISTCRYTMNGVLSVDNSDEPEEMIEFAKKCCEEFVPSSVFVMDIALYNGSFFIVECNCFNDSGFYEHNIRKIIQEVNKHLLNLQ